MIYIGIDISKYNHDCFIATETSVSFSFENNSSGFKELLEHFKPFNKSEMIIGLEATGHYGDNLKSFLSSHGFSFMEINPLLVKKFSDSKSLRKLKTDKKDAKLISEYMMTVDYKAYHHQSYHISALKSLTRERSKLISFRTAQYNMITKTLDIIFPEFNPFMKEQGYSDTSLYILSYFKSPDKIAKMTDLHYDKIRKKSMGKFSYPKFMKLKELAKETIGTSQDYHLDRLSTSISYVEKLNTDIKVIESRITELMKKYPTYFGSIKGIGTLTEAIILAEYGNISLYDSPSQMVSYAGLDSTIKQSGTMSTTGKLVKRGSKYLRSALINITLILMVNNPLFYAYYHKKKQEGKHHRVAQVNLAKKLIRVIHHLETTKTYFDSSLLK
ncbi:IS110 family RNA-guided transposase [Haploplasma axanthum]|uniref:Transposase IS116/IS110/IS902 family n=1 Tax=Haploplasma axanthum TaxID=29552 RepID=A0A449BBF0_HAPAX|nr:IS110 family transposase [Haploplasma axanthum]VEU79703.1 Transposase IS116/IS110/IS902 family [Haploplasma axanthum]